MTKMFEKSCNLYLKLQVSLDVFKRYDYHYILPLLFAESPAPEKSSQLC